MYKLWIEFHQHLTKTSRYTLGGKIDGLFLECIELIFIASYQPKERKLVYLDKSIGRFDLLKFLLRVAWETKVIELKKYVALSTPLDELGRMIGGWRNRLIKETQPPPKRG